MVNKQCLKRRRKASISRIRFPSSLPFLGDSSHCDCDLNLRFFLFRFLRLCFPRYDSIVRLVSVVAILPFFNHQHSTNRLSATDFSNLQNLESLLNFWKQ